MIYIKQPDGKIEHIETIDEDDRVQKIRAHNLDKQLAEQQGKEYGTVYNDAESLPDEDKVKVGIISKAEYDAKQAEIEKQKEAAEYEALIQSELRAMAIERIEAKKEK